MALAPRIEIRQNQSLVMTPQMQQAVKLLQMSNLSLADFVAAEVERNPLLEFAPSPAPRFSGSAGGGAGLDGIEAIEAEVGLSAHLRRQIGAARAPSATIAAASILADEIEEDGYLRVPLAEVAGRHGLRAQDAAAGLALLQSCDPAGVGARSLRECLALQLKDLNRLDPAMEALLDNLPLYARGRLAELQTLCGVDAEDMTDMLKELRALDPKPGLRFGSAPVQVAVPDVYVLRGPRGGWTVELNSETLPRVLMNNRYAAALGAPDAAARQFVSEMSASASWLVRSLEQRARTILKVTGELALRQSAFFEAGPSGLRPLTQRTIAEAVRLHESTVSRATAGKFFACEHGTFELGFLFNAAIRAVDGGESYAAAAVQDRIKALVAQEAHTRPLSDDKIMSALAAEGIDIARRTVAKYREVLGIPSSVERRRHKTSFSRI